MNTCIEFDSNCVDGSNVQFVRITQGNNAIVDIFEDNIGEWHHYKLVVDNTSKMKVYKDYSTTPTTRNINQVINWDGNVNWTFWTTGSNSEIRFKNFKVYEI